MQDPETQLPALFERYRAALEAGDLPRAVETAVEIEETTADVNDLLEDFRNALEAGEREVARTILGQLSDAYDRRGRDFEANVQRAMTALEEESLSEAEREELLRFTRVATQTNLNRTGFLIEAVSFFEGDQTESTLVETSQAVARSEQELEDASGTTSTSVGASPGLLGSSSPDEVTEGSSVELTVTVGNVGDEESVPLSLAVSADEGIEPARSTYDVGALAGGERVEIAIEVTGTGSGERNVTVKLRGDGSSVDSLNGTFTVLETPNSVREAIVGSDSDAIDSTDIQTAIGYWTDDRRVPGTAGETIDTEVLQSLVTEWVERNGGDVDD